MLKRVEIWTAFERIKIQTIVKRVQVLKKKKIVKSAHFNAYKTRFIQAPFEYVQTLNNSFNAFKLYRKIKSLKFAGVITRFFKALSAWERFIRISDGGDDDGQYKNSRKSCYSE